MTSDSDRQQVFERCVDTNADALYRVAFRLLGDATLANELVQDTYLNAWKNIDSLKDIERMRAWMFSILRNQYTKLLSKEKKFTRYTQSTPQIDGSQSADRRPSIEDVAAPIPKLDRQNKQIMIQNALQQLDDKHKLPLLLVSMEGMTVDQAATSLDLPRGTVLSRLHRGREKLKETLARSAEFNFGSGENDGH